MFVLVIICVPMRRGAATVGDESRLLLTRSAGPSVFIGAVHGVLADLAEERRNDDDDAGTGGRGAGIGGAMTGCTIGAATMGTTTIGDGTICIGAIGCTIGIDIGAGATATIAAGSMGGGIGIAAIIGGGSCAIGMMISSILIDANAIADGGGITFNRRDDITIRFAFSVEEIVGAVGGGEGAGGRGGASALRAIAASSPSEFSIVCSS